MAETTKVSTLVQIVKYIMMIAHFKISEKSSSFIRIYLFISQCLLYWSSSVYWYRELE